jgi:hypothetical protein
VSNAIITHARRSAPIVAEAQHIPLANWFADSSMSMMDVVAGFVRGLFDGVLVKRNL